MFECINVNIRVFARRFQPSYVPRKYQDCIEPATNICKKKEYPRTKQKKPTQEQRSNRWVELNRLLQILLNVTYATVALPTFHSECRGPVRGVGEYLGTAHFSFSMIPAASGVYLLDLVHILVMYLLGAIRPSLPLHICIFEGRPRVFVLRHL